MPEPQEAPGVVNQRPGTWLERLSGYTQTYSTADKTLGAYTADAESAAYTGDGGGVGTVSNAANLAKLADLNALRVAVENLRVFTEDLAQFVNAVVNDIKK